MDVANFRNAETIDIEVFTDVKVETYDVGYSVEDSDVQVKLSFDRGSHRIIADFSILVKVVSDKDSSKFITFKYEDSAVPYMSPRIRTKLVARHIGAHNLTDEEYEYLFGGAIDDLGYVTIDFE